jgi:hypothetical protein
VAEEWGDARSGPDRPDRTRRADGATTTRMIPLAMTADSDPILFLAQEILP